jgi:hypothetical protein
VQPKVTLKVAFVLDLGMGHTWWTDHTTIVRGEPIIQNHDIKRVEYGLMVVIQFSGFGHGIVGELPPSNSIEGVDYIMEQAQCGIIRIDSIYILSSDMAVVQLRPSKSKTYYIPVNATKVTTRRL